MKGMVILGNSHKLIKLAVAAVIVFFFAYQYYVGFYAAIATESAVYFEYTEGVEAVGTVIRSEKTISTSKDGTVHFMVANGEKVAKNGIIANIYENDSASAAAARIKEIEQQLAVIQDIEGYNNLTAVDMGTINARISSYLDALVYSTYDGRFSNAGERASELLTIMTRKQVATGEQSDFSALKDSLNAEKATLSGQMGSPKGTITADTAGYYVSNSDGLEDLLTTDDLTKYTPEFLTSVKTEAVPGEVVGKIVYDYEWFLATPVSLNDSMYYKTGEKVVIKTQINSVPRLTATVECINLSKNGDDAVIIFRCNEMNSELAALRTNSVTIIKNEHTGIRIDRDALRVVDGKTGVYVVSGLESKFVLADILFSKDGLDYAVCELNTTDSSKLRLYDEVIVKGKNLYDGKIIY